jgi:tRNA A-37 threonylcarbamoyl transferase component Bud32/tetratricopeptide (TPR) repeat protein
MSPKPPQSPESFLEQSLPDLVRRETAQAWTKRWIGQQIESYYVDELIGSGTHGVVFRARRTAPYERTVAIKLLPNLQGQAKARQFQNECQALADLQHPCILQILTAGLTEDGTPYLIMPFLSGVPIDDYVEKHGADWSRLADLARQLAGAMAFAHENGVVHCDLKPDNILVGEDGQVTVTDFGLAVRIDEMDDLAQRPSWAPGTIGYAAPEILLSRKGASPSVDIYSLGSVLYRLLTGEPPHQASGWLDTLVATVEAKPKPVRSCNPNVPAVLAETCDRCLAKEPQHRFASAAELELELASFLESHATNSRQPKWRRPVLNSIITLAVLASLLGLPLLLWAGQAGALLGWNEPQAVTPDPLSDQQVGWILQGIEEQLLRPGLKQPAEPGDFEETFETLKDAAKEMEALLSHAPTDKKVRHRTATGYFLLGRAAHWMDESDYADRSLARSEQMFRELHKEFPDEGFLFDFFHTLVVQATRAPPRETVELHLLALGIIEDLRETNPKNLDYSDAHACMLVSLAEDYTRANYPESVDLEQALFYARRAKELAEWTCRQPGSLPLHRKHVMTSTSALSEIARHQGDFEKSLKLAEVAYSEAIRLDEAMQISDSKHHRFDKLGKYAVALCNVGRLEEASACVEESQKLARQLHELDWPDAHLYDPRVQDLRDLIRELQGPVSR